MGRRTTKEVDADLTGEVWSDRMEILECLLEWQSNGQTVRSFCRRPDIEVSYGTIYNWINELERHGHEFVQRFARIKGVGYDAIADEMLDIADTAPAKTGSDDNQRIDPGDVQNRKLRIETREKLLAKWDPGRYGVKVGIELSADDKFGDVLEAARLRVLARCDKNADAVAEEEGDHVG
jgi:hypothetical protein